MQRDKQIAGIQEGQCPALILHTYCTKIIWILIHIIPTGLIETGLFFLEDTCPCYSIHCYYSRSLLNITIHYDQMAMCHLRRAPASQGIP